MSDDHARIKTLGVIFKARDDLRGAGATVASIRKSFKQAPEWLAYRYIEQRLKDNRLTARHFKDLERALAAIDKAVIDASSACDQILGAVVSSPKL